MMFDDRGGVSAGGVCGQARARVGRWGRRNPLRLFCVAGLNAALLFAATACQDNFQRAEVYAQQARTLFDAGDREGAFQAIQNAIALRDDNAAYFIMLGAIYMRMNSPVDAYNAFNQALELDEANVEALTFVANIGLQVGRVADASNAADRLLSLNPNSVVGLQVKGLSEMFGNKDSAAQGYADRILKISPRDEAGTIIHARLLAKQGKLQEALDFLDNALVQAQQSPGLLITKINLYRALRQPEPMVQTYAQLFKLVPNVMNSLRLDYINLLYKIGRTEDARKAARTFLNLSQVNLGEYQTLVRIWFEFDAQPFTRESFVEVRDLANPIGLINVGRYLLWRDEEQLADDLYFAVRPGIRPAAEGLHLRASRMLNRMNGLERNLDLLLERDPEDVDALILFTEFKRKQGKTNLALEAMQKAVEADPMDPEAYVVLAEMREAAGARGRAEQIFEDGFKRLPQDFLLIQHYTAFLRKAGDKRRAISATRSFARSLPSSVRAWTVFAEQCQWAGDPACLAEAEAGRRNALTVYQIDEAPGTPPDRGLLSRFQIRGS
jgi:tetratricopeptide (TPR) repeat protein